MKQVWIDFIQQPEVNGYKCMIVLVDCFSKWVEAETSFCINKCVGVMFFSLINCELFKLKTATLNKSTDRIKIVSHNYKNITQLETYCKYK